MAAALQIPKVTRPLEVSEKKAFSFVKKDTKFTTLTEKRKGLIDKVGGIKPALAIFTPFLLIAALGFIIFEAYAASTTISALLDSLGSNTNLNWIWYMLGFTLAIAGMKLGNLFFESFERDEITGRRSFDLTFYLYLFGSLAFISFQFIASKAIGDKEMAFMPYFIAGVAIMEIIFGGLLLPKALIYTFVFFIAIRLWFIHRGMGTTSRATNNSYRDYRAMRDVYNAQNQNNTLVLEGNDNIRRAIAYYSGINLANANINAAPATPIVPVNQVQQQNKNTQQPVANPIVNEANPQNGKTEPVVNNRQNQNTTEEEVERFINDDDNLTF